MIVRLHFQGLPFQWDPTNCILTSIPYFFDSTTTQKIERPLPLPNHAQVE
jgi:hypothetical protein